MFNEYPEMIRDIIGHSDVHRRWQATSEHEEDGDGSGEEGSS